VTFPFMHIGQAVNTNNGIAGPDWVGPHLGWAYNGPSLKIF